MSPTEKSLIDLTNHYNANIGFWTRGPHKINDILLRGGKDIVRPEVLRDALFGIYEKEEHSLKRWLKIKAIQALEISLMPIYYPVTAFSFQRVLFPSEIFAMNAKDEPLGNSGQLYFAAHDCLDGKKEELQQTSGNAFNKAAYTVDDINRCQDQLRDAFQNRGAILSKVWEDYKAHPEESPYFFLWNGDTGVYDFTRAFEGYTPAFREWKIQRLKEFDLAAFEAKYPDLSGERKAEFLAWRTAYLEKYDTPSSKASAAPALRKPPEYV